MHTLNGLLSTCYYSPTVIIIPPLQARVVHPSRNLRCSRDLRFLYRKSEQQKHGFGWKVSRRGLSVRCGGVARGSIVETDESRFSETVLESERPVLVEFVATWCGPCRLISSAMQWVAQEYQDILTVVKIDHDVNPKLIEEYKIYGLPTLILFKDGKEVPESRREGAITKAKLKEYIDGLLESISVA